MSGFESIIDQKQPIGILTTLLNSKKIPHALLFTGIEGVGKHNAAITFAMACNCASLDSGQLSEHDKDVSSALHHGQKQPVVVIPCGDCRSCKKIQADRHPDILFIRPTNSFIKIDQIRKLYQTLLLKPYEATYRVVIISDAQRMNSAASNAFLKILEEPPDRTVLILTATKKSDLLQTIVSRCQRIRFRPLSKEAITAELFKMEDTNEDDASVLASMSKGSLSKALSMSRTDWMSRRNWLIKAVGLDQPDAIGSKQAGLLFSISTQLLQHKDTLEDYLEIITSWLRDLIIFKYEPKKIIHKDCINKIENVSKTFSIQSLLHKMEAVQSVQFLIQRSNVNVKLALDTLMYKLTETTN